MNFPDVTYGALDAIGVTVVTIDNGDARASATMWVRRDMSLADQRPGIEDMVWEVGIDGPAIAHVTDVIIDELRDRGHV